MGFINTKFTSDDAEVNKAMQRMQQDVDKYRAKLEEATKSGKKLGEETSKAGAATGGLAAAGNSVVSSIRDMAAGYVGINALISAGTRLLQDQIDMQNKAARAQVTVADAQAAFRRNAGGVSGSELVSMESKIAAIASATGIKSLNLYQSGSAALSAKGSLSNMQSLDFLKQAAMVTGDDPSEMKALTGGLLDTASLTKSSDPRTNLGFLAALQTQSRVTSMSAVSSQLIPGSIAAQSYGGSAAESASGLATLTSLMKDPTGEKSKTAFSALARQAKDVSSGGIFEDVKALQSNPAMMKQFMAKGSFGESESFIRELLTKGSPGAKLWEQNLKSFPAEGMLSQGGAAYEAMVRGGDLQERAQYERRTGQQEEAAQVGNLKGGDFARYMDRFERVGSAMGMSYPARVATGAMARAKNFFSDDPETSMAGAMMLTNSDLKKEQQRAGSRGEVGLEKYLEKQVELMNTQINELRQIKAKQLGLNINAHVE